MSNVYDPIRAACYRRYYKALRTGELIRHPCSICGDQKSEGHHVDHSKPLEVTWFCHYHHSKHHGVFATLNPSENHRKFMSKVQKGRQKSPEECVRISMGNLGTKRTSEVLLKMSESQRRRRAAERMRNSSHV